MIRRDLLKAAIAAPMLSLLPSLIKGETLNGFEIVRVPLKLYTSGRDLGGHAFLDRTYKDPDYLYYTMVFEKNEISYCVPLWKRGGKLEKSLSEITGNKACWTTPHCEAHRLEKYLDGKICYVYTYENHVGYLALASLSDRMKSDPRIFYATVPLKICEA